METDREDEAPEGRKLAEQGNTDAKLFVSDESEEEGSEEEGSEEDGSEGDEG